METVSLQTVRVVYEASGDEDPVFLTLSTTPNRIVIGSVQAAAVGKIYVQFPCLMAEAVGGILLASENSTMRLMIIPLLMALLTLRMLQRSI